MYDVELGQILKTKYQIFSHLPLLLFSLMWFVTILKNYLEELLAILFNCAYFEETLAHIFNRFNTI